MTDGVKKVISGEISETEIKLNEFYSVRIRKHPGISTNCMLVSRVLKDLKAQTKQEICFSASDFELFMEMLSAAIPNI
jgi:hypothetical protein